MTLDNAGYLYIGGTTNGALGEANAGGYDAYIAKISTTNGSMSWIKQLGNVTVGAAANNDETIGGIALDASGNIYLWGSTLSNLGEVNSAFPVPGPDLFLVKFNSSGTKQWIKQFGQTTLPATGIAAGGDDRCAGNQMLKMGTDGYLIAAAQTSSSFAEANSGSWDPVVIKFDTSGNVIWMKQLGNITIGAGANNQDWVSGLSVDFSNNIYVSGQTKGNLGEVNGGGGLYDAYVFKLDTNGSLKWGKQLGNATLGAASSGDDLGYTVTFDLNGNIYLGGTTGGSMGEPNGGSNDAFYSKFDSSGNLQFVKQFGTSIGAAATGYDTFLGINVDANGKVYFVGASNGSWGEVSAGAYDIILYGN